MFSKLFLKHPRSINESYIEHQRAAFGYGASLIMAGLACLLHGLVPAFCVTTGSNRVAALHEDMSRRRRVAAPS